MLQHIINFSIKNKLIIGLMVFALIGYGAYQVTQLPIDAVPDITNNQVQVITMAPSFGATDIERLVTFPIEQANSNIAGMKEIRSFSRFGLSLVTIVFDDETDVYWARQQVAERLQQIQSQIPPGIGTPELGPVSTGLGEIYQYVVKPKKGYEHKYDATELRTIQDWIIRRQLLGVKGVAEVSSFGGKLKQYEIAIRPERLNEFHITIHDVFNALEQNNQNTGGSYIEKGPTVLYIRSDGLIKSKEDVLNIAISGHVGETPIFMRDIAEVNIGFATRYGAMCYNAEGEVAGAIVMMLKGANSSEVIKNVKQRIAAIQQTLPEGVEIEAFLDRTKMVSNAISTVEKNLLEGACIVVLVLVLFLGNLRAGLLVASVIPLAMLFAISMMNAFGVSGNLMSLGALDFGLIVDGAVIIVEAVMHQLSHNTRYAKVTLMNQEQMDKTVSTAATKMMNSAVFGQVIILIVYLPIFTLQGIEGKMFKPMAQTVAFALLGAFILSITYIPMMSSWLLSRKVAHRENLSDRVMHWVEGKYQQSFLRVLRFPKLVIYAVLSLFAISIFVLTTLGGEFIPALEEGDFAVDTRVLSGSNLNTTIAFTQKAAGLLKARFPEVEKVVTKIGSGEVPTDPMPMEASDMMVILKDKSEWTSAKTFPELSEKMSAALDEIPGITAGFQFPVQMRFNELMTGARQDVVCKIFGENLDTLAAYAAKLGEVVKKVEGAENLFLEPVTGMPQVVIQYKRPMLAQYHVSVADINRVINTAFAGQSTGMLFEDEKRFDLVVRLHANERRNLDDVKNLLIPVNDQLQLPLSQFADVAIINGPNQIQREDAKRRIVVGFNVRGRDVQSIVHELQEKVKQQLKLPVGYYITYGGSFENLEQAKQRLLIAVPVSLLLIFVLLFFAFNSLKHGLLIYSAIPLSAIGGILFLAVRGLPFSISAGVGFIALFGVAVLNGIVLIAEFNRLKDSGLQSLPRIVLRGTQLRLRPVLMTAFVASLGFLPMAVSNGAGAEVQRPLATVVIGGLLVATFLTLMVLPLLYMIVEHTHKRKRMMNPKIALLIVLIGSGKFMQAQVPIPLSESLNLAKQQNASVLQEQRKSDFAKQKIQSVSMWQPLNINSEYGQINSNYLDSKFSVTQSMTLPAVSKRQRQLLQEEATSAELEVPIKVFQIEYEVTKQFYQYLYLDQKIRLYSKVDSMYQQLLQRANLRLQKGESTIVEKSLVLTQHEQYARILNQLYIDQEICLSTFRWLLQTDSMLVPQGSFKDQIELRDTMVVEQLPFIQWYGQQQRIAKAQTSFLKTQLLPEISFGYANTSIRGVGANEIYYNGAKRFHSAQVGLMIPLFAKTQKSAIQLSKRQEEIQYEEMKIATSTVQLKLNQRQWERKQLLASYKRLLEQELPSVKQIQMATSLQFKSGEINYLEWVVLHQQVITTELNLIDLQKALIDNSMELHFLIH